MIKHQKGISQAMFIVSIAGFLITFPLWVFGVLTDRQMLGITLVLSWAALWYAAYIALIQSNNGR